MDTISVRVDDVTGLDFFGKVLNENRSETLRTLVNEGKKAKALELYKKRKISLGLGAKLAGVTLSEFIDLLKETNLILNIELDDVKAALENAEKYI